jgi:nucleotide-binding universal stress UspA family protein
MNPIRKILVPTDFSAHADEAFRTACTLAAALGAEVVVFHIAPPPTVVTADGELLADRESAAVNLWDRFRDLQPGDRQVRVKHEVIVEERPTARHILDMLDRQGCDLIVMGTHGRSWIKRALFGSVTKAVVRSARCPVMVVKAPRSPQNLPAKDRRPRSAQIVAATAQPHAREI